MSNAVANYTVPDMERMALAFAGSKLFGVQNADQALALCLIAQAEGRHPASAAQDYHIIQGKPSKKADAMLRDFLNAGGKVEWHRLDDEVADATFSHPAGGSVRIAWDHPRALKAQIKTPMWAKYPRQMLRARVVSEGVRTVFPMATSGMYVPEEVSAFDDVKQPPKDVTPAAIEGEIIAPDEPGVEKRRKFAKADQSREIDTEMRQEIDACMSEDQLQALWLSKPFANELARHPDDWREMVIEYFNERLQDMRTPAGYVAPSFDQIEPEKAFT